MTAGDDVEVWNLADGVPAVFGAQDIFNVVGRVREPERVASMTYVLNGAPRRSVAFAAGAPAGRLARTGDFNIDTITSEELRRENDLALHVRRVDRTEATRVISFPAVPLAPGKPAFRLDLSHARGPQEVGQVVDGRWRVVVDERGERCLEIARRDAGYDRIILFGSHAWTHGYAVSARLVVPAWTHHCHNVGLLFKWNPHERGDGDQLPTRWSTGLGYYAWPSPGLRLRVGVGVHVDREGRKLGDLVLAERPLSNIRRALGRPRRRLGLGPPPSQIVPGRQYRFHLRVAAGEYALAVWPAARRRPAQPQLVASAPLDRLPTGAVGLIVLNGAVRLYEFEVEPLAAA